MFSDDFFGTIYQTGELISIRSSRGFPVDSSAFVIEDNRQIISDLVICIFVADGKLPQSFKKIIRYLIA